MDPAADTLGFVGLGVMGSSMAGHLLDAGYRLIVHTRTKGKAAGLLERGAAWAGTPADLAGACSAVFTMLGYPSEVREVYLGNHGLVETCRPGTVLVDMTTSQPGLACEIHGRAAGVGIGTLDAPVSGGDVGARNATLAIMVGGKASDYERVLPLLGHMGRNIVYQGEAGSGQHAKMSNQIALAGALAGTVEALVYARRMGLDPAKVVAAIGSGAAGSWQLSTMGPRMLSGDFAPGFYAKHFLKDLGIALESARALNLRLPMLDLVESFFRSLVSEGYGELGTQALFLLYERGSL